MTDISATGSTLTIYTPLTKLIPITQFADDTTPFEFNEVEVTGSGLSINGELVVWAKPVAYAVSISVIPNTMADLALRQILKFSSVRKTPVLTLPVQPALVNVTLVATIPLSVGMNGNEIQGVQVHTFSNGRIVSGPTAPSANNEGRLVGRTYTFVFESLDSVP